MRLQLLLVGLLSAAPVQAGDWRDSLSAPTLGAFPSLSPLRATYRFGWGAIPAARAEFQLARTPSGEQRLTMTTATFGAVRALWRMDARHEALCRPETATPRSVLQTESYRDEIHRTSVTFDSEGVSRIRESKPADGKPATGKAPRTKRFELPNVFDLQTGLLFVRSQTLAEGETYSIVVYPSTDAYRATIRVLGREKIKVAGRQWPALKLDIQLQSINRKLELEPHRKFRKATAWLSDDRERMLLQVKAEVFVGSVWAEMETLEGAQ